MDSYDALEAKLEADTTMAEADAQELLKMHCFDFVWDNPTDPVAYYVMYRYKWSFGPCELRTMLDNIHHADSTLSSSTLTMIEEYVEKLERVQAGQPMIDFTQNDPEGNPVTLSTLAEGKLLLIDTAGLVMPVRVAVFAAVGILLIVGATLYLKFKERFEK